MVCLAKHAHNRNGTFPAESLPTSSNSFPLEAAHQRGKLVAFAGSMDYQSVLVTPETLPTFGADCLGVPMLDGTINSSSTNWDENETNATGQSMAPPFWWFLRLDIHALVERSRGTIAVRHAETFGTNNGDWEEEDDGEVEVWPKRKMDEKEGKGTDLEDWREEEGRKNGTKREIGKLVEKGEFLLVEPMQILALDGTIGGDQNGQRDGEAGEVTGFALDLTVRLVLLGPKISE